jgi:Ca-activated chloride channel homolog
LVAAAVAVMWYGRFRRRKIRLALGIESPAQAKGSRRNTAMLGRLRAAVVLAAMALLVVAAAGPRVGTEPREIELSGLDIVVALDVSRSMLAEDVAPSRLDRAREEVLRLAERAGDDRIGLVTFAADAFMQMPLTSDRAALRLFLQTASPDMIPAQGTSFANMLAVAARVFDGSGEVQDRSRVLLIVSDGEDHEAGIEPPLRRLREMGVVVLALGVGTTEGALIPVLEDGRPTHHRDRDGLVVTARLEEGVLRGLAIDGGYFAVSRRTSGVEHLIQILESLDRRAYGSIVYDRYIERYQIPLAAAIVLLGSEILLRGIRRREKTVAAA